MFSFLNFKSKVRKFHHNSNIVDFRFIFLAKLNHPLNLNIGGDWLDCGYKNLAIVKLVVTVKLLLYIFVLKLLM